MLVDFSLAVTGEETVGALELFVFDSLEDFVFFLLVVSLDLVEVVIPEPVEELSAFRATRRKLACTWFFSL